MNRLKSIIVISILILSFIFCGCTSEPEDYIINNSDKIYMGVLLPMSGDYTDLGQRIVEGIEYASSLAPTVQLDKEYRIEIIIKDSNSSLDSSVEEMISKNVSAVICAGGDKEYTDAIISSFDDTNTPLIFVDNCSELISTSENVFSISTPYKYQASAATSYLVGEGYETGAVVCADDDEYYKAFAQMFDNTFVSNGGTSVSTYYYSGELKNFSAATIAGAGLDFVFIIGSDNDCKLIYSELKNTGNTSQVMFSEVLDKTKFKDEAFNGASFISRFEEDDNNYIGSDFINTYSEEMGVSASEITAATAYGYDAYMTIYEVLRNFNQNSQSLIMSGTDVTTQTSENSTEVTNSQVLEGINNVEHYGVTDTITFSDDGTAVTTYIYIDSVENSHSIMLNRYDFNNEQN